MFAKSLIVLAALPALVAAQGPRAQRDTIPTTRRAIPVDTSLHPISLQEALRLSKTNALSAVTAQNSIKSAQAQLKQAKGERLPNLSLSVSQNTGGGERIDQARGVLVPFANNKWNYSSGLNTQVTLLDWGTATSHVRQQEANVSQAVASETSTEFNVALSVKQQYNAILAANEQEAAGYAQLDAADAQLQAASAKVAAGAAIVSDSLKAVVAVGSAQLQIIQARNTRKTASAALTHFVGTPYLVTAVASDTIDRRFAPVDSVAVVEMALSSPQIRQSEMALNAQEASRRAAHVTQLPKITDRKSTRLNSSHVSESRMPSSA